MSGAECGRLGSIAAGHSSKRFVGQFFAFHNLTNLAHLIERQVIGFISGGRSSSDGS
jgi:hypothetical protein